jgi:hypothetical protein
METEGLNFREAVDKLAGEVGMQVPRTAPKNANARNAKRPFTMWLRPHAHISKINCTGLMAHKGWIMCGGGA